MRQDPSAYGLAFRSSTSGRSWSFARPSGRGTETLHEGGGGEPGDERDSHDSAAARLDPVAADDVGAGVVGALDEDIGLERVDEVEWSVVVEEDDAVDGGEGSDDACPRRFGHERTLGALGEAANRGVGVEADDEGAAFATADSSRCTWPGWRRSNTPLVKTTGAVTAGATRMPTAGREPWQR